MQMCQYSCYFQVIKNDFLSSQDPKRNANSILVKVNYEENTKLNVKNF